MKKYFILLFISSVLTFSISGCGNKAETEPQVSNVQETLDTETEDELQTETVPSDTPAFYGVWEVWDYQEGNITALSTEEMENFIGHTISYEADAILVNEYDIGIDHLEYESEEYTEEMLEENYGVNLGEWWNEKEQVTYISITSEENFFGSQLFVADEDTIWIYFEGVFFLARQVEG